ncbi:MAG: tetratricopeptide repeat protein, partial [Euryarchaeota archaeon]|nr:tetratricopeptide repeat protein [Euryarchaeota archaeon]
RMMNRAFSHNREDLVDVELQGLRPSDAEEVVRRAGHEADGLSLEGTKGNPLLIQMAVRSRGGEEPRSPSDYVDNLWSHLSEKERECLKALAIYREFVPPAALNKDTDVIFDLRAKGIVQKRESWVMLHDLIGSRVRQLTAEEERVPLHKTAWEYYSKLPDRDHLMEGMYHLAEAGDRELFVDVLDRNGESLLDRPDDLIALVDKMRPKVADRTSDLTLLFWRARALLSLERYDDAERALDTILTAEEVGPKMKGSALETLADLHHMVEEWDEALAGYKKALAHYEASRDPGSQAREWLNIGRTLRIRGDRTASLEAYDRAESLVPKDKRLIALIFNNRGMVEWGAGRLEEAEREFRESIRRSRENKDPLSEGMALQNLVDLYQESLRYDEMMLAGRDASDAFIRADDFDSYANMQIGIASHLERSGRPHQALEVLQQALSKIKGSVLAPGHASTRAKISISEMEMFRRMGRPRESIEAGRGFERSKTLPADVAARLGLEMALAEADLGELDKALSHLDMAASLLTEAGDQVGLILVLIEKGEIEERRGNSEEASKLYREAAWRADGTGDKMGLATALEYLFYIIGNEMEEGRMAKERAIRTYDELALPERAARIEANLGDRPTVDRS